MTTELNHTTPYDRAGIEANIKAARGYLTRACALLDTAATEEETEEAIRFIRNAGGEIERWTAVLEASA